MMHRIFKNNFNSKPMLQDRTIELMQPVDLTEPELIATGKELGDAWAELGQIEAEKKRVMKEYADKITAQEFVCNRLALIQQTGQEYRPVKCHWVYHEPTIGEKILYREDTGEAVESAAMSQRDFDRAEELKQLELDLS